MRLRSASIIGVVFSCAACSPTGPTTASGTGGSVASGGQQSANGGASGGVSAMSGGTSTVTSGGSSSGGASAGGASTSGGASAGTSSGGIATSGGSAAGGAGASNGGAAGAPSAGASNAGAAGSAGAPSGGATGGTILLKDNFDTSTVGMPPDMTKWMAPVPTDPNQPKVDATRAHSLPNSAHVTGMSTPNTFLVFNSGLPAPNNKVYARAFVNFEKATSAVMGHIGFIVGADSRDNSGTELRLGISIPPGFSSAMLDLNLQNPKDGAGGEVTRFSNGYTTGGNPLNMAGTTLEANRWYCIETLFNGGANEFDLWIDGVELMNLHVTDFDARGTTPRTKWAPMFTFLKFGAQNYGGDIGQIWYDDIVIGTDRIFCN